MPPNLDGIRILYSAIIGSNGWSLVEHQIHQRLVNIVNQFKVTSIEAKKIGPGRVVFTIYGKPLEPGEHGLPLSLKIVRVTEEHLNRPDYRSDIDDRNQLLGEEVIKVIHITSASPADGELLFFCLFV